jgi:hypothetical protein
VLLLGQHLPGALVHRAEPPDGLLVEGDELGDAGGRALVHDNGVSFRLVDRPLGLGAGVADQGGGLGLGVPRGLGRLLAGLGEDLRRLLARPGDHVLDLLHGGCLLARCLVRDYLEHLDHQLLALGTGQLAARESERLVPGALYLAQRPAHPLLHLALVVAACHGGEVRLLSRRESRGERGEFGGAGLLRGHAHE